MPFDGFGITIGTEYAQQRTGIQGNVQAGVMGRAIIGWHRQAVRADLLWRVSERLLCFLHRKEEACRSAEGDSHQLHWSNRLMKQPEACVVRITDAEGNTLGTSFLVSADGPIATCA